MKNRAVMRLCAVSALLLGIANADAQQAGPRRSINLVEPLGPGRIVIFSTKGGS